MIKNKYAIGGSNKKRFHLIQDQSGVNSGGGKTKSTFFIFRFSEIFYNYQLNEDLRQLHS